MKIGRKPGFAARSRLFEIEDEGCSLAHFADDRDVAAIATDKFVAYNQSQPRALLVGQTGSCYWVVGFEKPLLVLGRDADSRVADGNPSIV